MVDEWLWFVRILETVSLFLGITIAYYAYMGYRRTRQHAVLLAAFGFGLLSTGALTEGILFELFNTPLLLAHGSRAAVTVLGLLLLLASIRRMSD